MTKPLQEQLGRAVLAVEDCMTAATREPEALPTLAAIHHALSRLVIDGTTTTPLSVDVPLWGEGLGG